MEWLNISWIEIKKYRVVQGILLSIFSFFLTLIFDFSLIFMITMPLIFLLTGLVTFKKSKISLLLFNCYCFLFPLFIVYCSQLILNMSIFEIKMYKLILGYLVVVFIIMFFLFITNNCHLSLFISSLIFTVLSLINQSVILFRGNEFVFSDIFSINTALNVINNYSFKLNATIFYALMIILWMIFFLYSFPRYKIENILMNKVVSFLIIFFILLVLIYSSQFIPTSLFLMEGSTVNGFILNFALSIKDTIIFKPYFYDIKNINNVESLVKNEIYLGNEPNIIVVMNESFANFEVLGKDLFEEKDFLNFYKSLSSNSIKGHALTSVFGGGTSNSEYEFLTGNSLGFLANNSNAYQQYITTATYSIVNDLNRLQYNCIATHPYYANGWSRTDVYSNFGFDEYYFMNSYPQKDLIRNYTSDQEMYEWVIDKYESNINEKQFIFGITMQNHGGYNYEGNDFENTISLKGYSQSYPDVEQYLTVLNKSDKAIEYLLDYFEKREEPIVVVFFGDHLPRLNQSFYDEVHGGPYDTLEEQMLMYTVPFFVWANYDIEEQNVGLTSLNYLSNYMYEVAGIPLPAYNQFLKELQKEIPAINALGFYSKADECFKTFEQANDREKKLLNTYEQLQYNCMFDEKNRSEILFPVPSEEQINSVERHD